jgi:hypothetical protein
LAVLEVGADECELVAAGAGGDDPALVVDGERDAEVAGAWQSTVRVVSRAPSGFW